jgi:WD40 repeat protein
VEAGRIRDARSGELRPERPGSSLPRRNLVGAFSPNGKTVAVEVSGRVRFWSVEDEKEVPLAEDRIRFPEGVTPTSIRYTPDGKKLLLGAYSKGKDGGAERRWDTVWDMTTGKRLGPVEGFTQEHHVYRAARLSPDGRLLMLSDDSHVEILDWAARGGRILLTHDDGFYAGAAFTPAADKLLTTRDRLNRPGTVTLTDARTGRELATFPTTRTGRQVGPLTVSCDGKVLAVAFRDAIRLYRTEAVLPGQDLGPGAR